MDINLFVAQLNQILQNSNAEMLLEDICMLLSSHTCATVKITDYSGHSIVEILQPNASGSATEHRLTMPIIAEHMTLGNMLLCRHGDPFNETESLALGVALSICTVLLRQRHHQLATDSKRRRDAVRNLINTLSFSELEASVQMLKSLENSKTEGLLVAGHIADRLGFTRSVVTAALKKLEGASLIETRSLGMKGTYIRIKDVLLIEELNKL